MYKPIVAMDVAAENLYELVSVHNRAESEEHKFLRDCTTERRKSQEEGKEHGEPNCANRTLESMIHLPEVVVCQTS